MKNILMSLVLLGTFAAMSAKGDSYLFWMTDATEYEVYPFDTAVLIAKGGDTEQVIGAATFGGGKTTARMASEALSTLPTLEEGSWSFYVELYKDSWWVGQSTSALDINGNPVTVGTDGIVSYSAAYAAEAIYQSLNPTGLGAVNFTNFTSTPEPTSGMLVLLGLCGLALKRKRA